MTVKSDATEFAGKRVLISGGTKGLGRATVDRFLAGGARLIGRGLWKGGDAGLIDGLIVGGAVSVVGWISTVVRFFQTGHIYNYAFTMIFGVCALLSFWLLRA